MFSVTRKINDHEVMKIELNDVEKDGKKRVKLIK